MLIKNFLFHRVSNEADILWPPMQPELFERIIAKLMRTHSVVPLEYYLSDPTAFATPKKTATVLFDDGYKDNIEFAAPILKKYNCPASFYVVSDCIDKNIPTWTYIVDNVFQHTRVSNIQLDFTYVPEQLKTFSPANGNNSAGVRAVKPWMKSLSNVRRLEVMESLLHQCSDVPPPDNKMMSWSDISQLSQEGFIIGSHSHTHPMLASLAEESEIQDELSVSFCKIKDATGKEPLSISYPIGSFDERVKKIAASTGYTYGLAVKQQFYKPAGTDFFEIPRVELYQEPWWKTKLRISGAYSTIRRLWK